MGLLHGASPGKKASTRGHLSNKIQDITYGFLQSQFLKKMSSGEMPFLS
jgi:hypothetical protein